MPDDEGPMVDTLLDAPSPPARGAANKGCDSGASAGILDSDSPGSRALGKNLGIYMYIYIYYITSWLACSG
jgi:hypothetical protein